VREKRKNRNERGINRWWEGLPSSPIHDFVKKENIQNLCVILVNVESFSSTMFKNAPE
jgi:hypothetical protein